MAAAMCLLVGRGISASSNRTMAVSKHFPFVILFIISLYLYDIIASLLSASFFSPFPHAFGFFSVFLSPPVVTTQPPLHYFTTTASTTLHHITTTTIKTTTSTHPLPPLLQWVFPTVVSPFPAGE
jgi:hypothetical protein